jgi:hypothetical protein
LVLRGEFEKSTKSSTAGSIAPGQLCGGERRRNPEALDARAGRKQGNLRINSIVEDGTAAKDSTSLSQRELSPGQLQGLCDAARKPCQGHGRFLQDLFRKAIAGLGSFCHQGKYARVNFVGSLGNALGEDFPCGGLNGSKNPLSQNGRGALILLRAENCVDGPAAYVIGAAFVTLFGTEATCARRLSLAIAAKGGGACARNQDDTLTGSDGSSEGDFKVRRHAHGGFREHALKEAGEPAHCMRPSCSRKPSADTVDLIRRDPRRGQGALGRFAKRRASFGKAGTPGIGRPRTRFAQDLAFLVDQDAISLRSATVQSEKIVH